MSAPESPRAPSDGELRWFGLIVLLFFGLIGGVIAWQGASTRGASIAWGCGAVLALAYYAVHPLRRPMYALWMAAVAPIGFAISQLLLGLVYFLVLTPTALVTRSLGRDPLTRRFEPEADSYWVAEDPGTEPARYYRQS